MTRRRAAAHPEVVGLDMAEDPLWRTAMTHVGAHEDQLEGCHPARLLGGEAA